jgi:phosphonoacetaldehyde hydrolase
MGSRVKGVIFDWAGTTVDFGCFAPLDVFLEIFRSRDIEITMKEARAPMGMLKIDHIRAILDMERVAKLWEGKFGHPHTEKDVKSL